MYEPHGFIHQLEYPNESPSEGSNEDLRKDVGKGLSLNPNDGVDFIKEMVSNMSKVIASQNQPREKYDALTMDQCEVIMKTIQPLNSQTSDPQISSP